VSENGRLVEESIVALAEQSLNRGWPGVVKGVGDDAAVVEGQAGKWLMAADLLMEGVHFRRSWMGPADLARKVLSINLSDLAAMGGRGSHALLSLALPGDVDQDWVEAFFEALAESASRFGVAVIGGDTTGSPGPIMAHLSLWGPANPSGVIYRSGAKEGDRLFVSRLLGGAAAGLAGLEQGLELPEELRLALCNPFPEVELGYFLGESGSVSAMIDLSDGLAVDTARLARASGLAAVIEAEKIPLAGAAEEMGRRLKIEPLLLGLEGGEDYALLMTCPSEKANEFRSSVRSQLERTIFEIGWVEKGEGAFLVQKGERRPLDSTGFNHFSLGSGKT